MSASSAFNLAFELDGGNRYFIQNSLTGKGAFVDSELCKALLYNPVTIAANKELIDIGAIIESENTERLCLEMEMNRFRYSSSGHISLTIVTTSMCNLCCPYCYQSALVKDKISEVMDAEVEKALLPFVEAQLSGHATEYSVTWTAESHCSITIQYSG